MKDKKTRREQKG